MTHPLFASFNYQHPDRVRRSRARVVFTTACLVASFAAMAWVATPVGYMLLAVTLIYWFCAPRQLLLGPRYLLCGDTIVYFGNVKRMTLSPALGKLRLECTNGKSFALERDKFSAPALSANKCAKYKAQKFDAVSTEIMKKVRAAAPHVVALAA